MTLNITKCKERYVKCTMDEVFFLTIVEVKYIITIFTVNFTSRDESKKIKRKCVQKTSALFICMCVFFFVRQIRNFSGILFRISCSEYNKTERKNNKIASVLLIFIFLLELYFAIF